MKKVVLSFALVAMMFVSCKETEATPEVVEETAVETVEAAPEVVEEVATEVVDSAAAKTEEVVEEVKK